MEQPERTKRSRHEWFKLVLPSGIPKLWCPPVTHYDDRGAIDRTRILAHLRFISPWVKGILVPGSTGDGWELTGEESQAVLDVALEAAQRFDMRVLVGALRPVSSDACQVMTDTARRLIARTGSRQTDEWLAESRVCGFAVCPPRGAALAQSDMQRELSGILELGLPTALYQLPQVTQNEMSPELVANLAEPFGNFLLFKDTSGRDAVACSGRDLHGVFLVRGMEGEYERWLKPAGGPYDGFLLSAANCFPRQLHRVIDAAHAGLLAEAREAAQKLSTVVTAVFGLVKDVSGGNAFANANKALDHFFAYGQQAAKIPPPRLHSGGRLPVEVVRAVGSLLASQGLLPERGYME